MSLISFQVGKSGSSLRPSWSRHCVFDREVGLLFQSLVSEASLAKVESVTKKKMLKEPPPGLKTVELLRAASTGHHIGPHEAMSLSERLYIKVDLHMGGCVGCGLSGVVRCDGSVVMWWKCANGDVVGVCWW